MSREVDARDYRYVKTGADAVVTIEEARQELLEHAGVVCYDGHGVDAIMQLTDAYALAVLEEAVRGARYVPHSKALWIITLRARIEALGRAEDGT